ncbi:MAG TPA: AI-2E family transporter [Burkholderiaceae bacterium]|nr:AI-2E family transporter [Burkholderiaceae bacterium]
MRRPSRHPTNTTTATALVVIATIVTIGFLHWARSFLVPIAFGVVLSFAFNPLVRGFSRCVRVSRWMGSAAIVALFWGGVGTLAYALEDDVTAFATRLPRVMTQLASSLEAWRRNGGSSMQQLREAAQAIERVATEPVGESKSSRTSVQIEIKTWRLSDLFWSGSAGVALLIGQLITVTFLMLFLLGGGEDLKRKLVRFAGRSLSIRKRALRMVSAVGEQIQVALFVLLATNALFGLAISIGMHVLGIENAGLWGVGAGLAHFIPYFGSGISVLGVGLAAWSQTQSLAIALGLGAYVLIAATLIGVIVATWMQSRMSRMDSVMVFIALLFWGWLWGIPGLLLAMPITAILKAVCDHVDRLKPVADLFGELPPRAATRKPSTLKDGVNHLVSRAPRLQYKKR